MSRPVGNVAARLARLGKSRDDLATELMDDTKEFNETTEEILHRWELQAETDEDRRSRNLGYVNEWCSLKGDGLSEHRLLLTTPPLYELVGPRGTARLTSAQLAEWRYAKVKISDVTGQAPSLPPGLKWPTVWSALLNAATPTDVGALGTEAGQVAEWIGGYLNRAAIEPKFADAVDYSAPYWDGDDVCVFATTLLAYLRDVLKERIDSKQLAVMMRSAATPEKVNIPGDGRSRSTANIYRLPPALHSLDAPQHIEQDDPAATAVTAARTGAYARRGR